MSLLGNVFGNKDTTGEEAERYALDAQMRYEQAKNQMQHSGGYQQMSAINTAWTVPGSAMKQYGLDPNVLGIFRVVKATNGYIVTFARTEGERFEQIICADMAAVGEAVIGAVVANRLEK
jgi:hypothetical protein